MKVRFFVEEKALARAREAVMTQKAIDNNLVETIRDTARYVAHEFNNILTTIINYAKLGLRPDAPAFP